VVDEGLLGLTRHQTPNPWDYFYAREALAVKTWDLYDHGVGVYGAAMERMLAIGGDDAGGPVGREARQPLPSDGPLPGPVSSSPRAEATRTTSRSRSTSARCA
jgi:hypothetical protein